jgi:hypothetical protein
VVAFTSTDADDIVTEEPEVVLEHHILKAPRDVSLDEAMGKVCWVLNQAQDVLRQESRDNNNERRCLQLWASMLKDRTTSEKVMAQARHLDTREDLLNQQLAAINRRDADSQWMLTDAKELFTSAKTRASAIIK